MKKFLVVILGMVLLAAVGCGSEQKQADGKLPVVASFYPMADFTRQIGGDLLQVDTLIADGVEPHDWEPTAKDLTKLGNARLFVYNGGVENWARPALEAVKDKQVASVEAGKGLFDEKATHVDPHVWLSPRKAVLEVAAITAALVQADPEHAAVYKKNSEAYQEKLLQLDQRLTELAAKAPQKLFVTTHAAFGHLAEDYGLQQVAIMGISPDAEPTPADLKNLISTIKDNQVKYVFFETLVSPRIAQTVAEASGAETLVLDPLEGLSEAGRNNGDDYLKIMTRNIDNLELALGSMENIIKINKLGYNYGEGWILHDLSVEIVQGDFVAVIGPNGAGKSTLLRLLAGILQPTSGEIELYGTPLPQFKAWEKIGYVPQNPAKQHRDFPISVKEVIGLGLLCGSSMFQKISRAGKARVETMLERFYLQELAHRKIGELSGGQQQRVFLARAMVRQPELLLLDEPATGVDPDAKIELYRMLRDINRELGVTIVMVSHDLELAAEVAHNALCLDHDVCFWGDVQQALVHRHKHGYFYR